ncbi:MAG: hypothetical protein ACI9CZ_001826, partial [Flavobacterium sp.]
MGVKCKKKSKKMFLRGYFGFFNKINIEKMGT